MAEALADQGLAAKARAQGEQVFIDYEAMGQGTGYVRPSVLLEFGARSTGEPNEQRRVLCDAAQHLPDVSFPEAVAAHKSIFFAESTPNGTPIDYRAAVTGALMLAPSGEARQTLAEDYQRMVEDGLLLEDAEPVDVLLQRCQALALKVNAAMRRAV
jgi:hypothetical protein